MNLRQNPYGPIHWCLAFRENLYGPVALRVRQKFSPRLVLVHGWLFPVFGQSCYSPQLILSLVVPYCAIPRDYLSDTPLLRTMGFLVSQHGQMGAIPPPPFLSVSPLGEHAKCRCDTPPPEGVSQRYWRDTL